MPNKNVMRNIKSFAYVFISPKITAGTRLSIRIKKIATSIVEALVFLEYEIESAALINKNGIRLYSNPKLGFKLGSRKTAKKLTELKKIKETLTFIETYF